MRVFRVMPASKDWTETRGWWCPGVTVLAESAEQALEMIKKNREWMEWENTGDLTIEEKVGPQFIRDPYVDI